MSDFPTPITSAKGAAARDAAAASDPVSAAQADLSGLAAATADEARAYLETVTAVAGGDVPDTAIPVLLMAVSQALVAGARLGAIADVLPTERFEPDAGPDPDVDPVRGGLASLFEGIDEYVDVVDPLVSGEVVRGALSDDLADVSADLLHGLRHYEAGQVDEALWWWQFSYLSTWGSRGSSALRVLQSVLGHLRLDADHDTVADAQFDALHVR